MALLPDLGTAGLYAVAVFLLILGVLVVFVETVRPPRLALVVGASIVAAVGLAVLGEIGLALIPMGIAAAFVANQAFEWLTAR